MNSLNKDNLLVIAPHFRVFIRDQIMRLSDYFENLNVLIPIPYFSEVIRQVPYFGDNFSFLDWSIKDPEHEKNIKIDPIRFFTAPIEIARRSNHIRISKACLKIAQKRKLNPQIVHTHFLFLGAAGARIKSKFEVPFIMTVHGADAYDIPFRNLYYKNEAKKILEESDMVISVSKYNAKKLENLGVRKNKIKVIPNGFDSSLFHLQSKTETRKLLGLPSERPILLTIGRLERVKGHATLLKAVAELVKTNLKPYLVVIGSGSLSHQLSDLVGKLKLHNNVRFFGSIHHEDIGAWIGASDLFILPSFRESFPTVIPEVLACGRPIIASNVGGIPEIINDDGVGLVIQPGSERKLSEAIREALERNWDASHIANHAHPYSYEKLIPKIVEVFETFI